MMFMDDCCFFNRSTKSLLAPMLIPELLVAIFEESASLTFCSLLDTLDLLPESDKRTDLESKW
jgi:hypothetical protein